MKILLPILLMIWFYQPQGEMTNPKDYDVDTLELANRIPFDKNGYTLGINTSSILEMIANSLIQNPTDTLIVKGFESEDEQNDILYGNSLSFTRARAVKNVLVEKYSIEEKRIKITKFEYGECRCAKLYLIKKRYFKQVDFDNDRYTIKAQAYYILGEVADSLVKNPSDTLTVKGFALEQIGGYSGQRLSYKRAKSIKDAMVNDFGIKEERIKITFNFNTNVLSQVNTKEDDCKCAKLYLLKQNE